MLLHLHHPLPIVTLRTQSVYNKGAISPFRMSEADATQLEVSTIPEKARRVPALEADWEGSCFALPISRFGARVVSLA